MTSDTRNSFPGFDRPSYLQGEFAQRIRENPKIHYDPGRKTFSFKKKFIDAEALVDILYQNKGGVEDKEDLHDDVSQSKVQGLVEKNLLRLVEIRENKSKTVRVLLSKNPQEDPVEQMNLEETAPIELGGYWDLFDKSQYAQDRYAKYSASEYLYRDPKMTVRQKPAKRRRRTFFDDTDITKWQNQHILEKIEEAMDILDKQAAPENRRPIKKIVGPRK
jgi:hypothetical protein